MSHYGVRIERSSPLDLPPHPQHATEATFVDWAKSRVLAGQRLAVDLFSGAGGLSLGLEDAGWTVAAAVDHDRRALETHRHNMPGLALDLDLGDPAARHKLVAMLEEVPIDLVAGGPPCQPFSRAGRSKIRSLVEAGTRDEHDHRKELWAAFLDVAMRLRPRAILMENVPDMALGDDLLVVRTIVDRLEHEGYNTEVRLVDAWRYGVPQHRKRLIVLARNDGIGFKWPKETVRQVTLEQAIADLPPLKDTTGARELSYQAPVGLSSLARRLRSGAPRTVVHDHMTRAVRPDDRQVFELMDATTLYSAIPERLRRYKSETFDDKYKRLAWDQLSRSITAHIAKDGYWYIHPQEHRTLTVREAARIQTFPDRFRFSGTRSDAFRQIGNAVPPLLGMAAACALRPPGPGRACLGHPGVEQSTIGAALARWADDLRSGDDWFMFPGPEMTPAAAVMAVVLATARTPLQDLRRAMKVVRGVDRLGAEALEKVGLCLPRPASQKALFRLSSVCEEGVDWDAASKVASAVAFGAAEARLFRVLTNQDVLLITAAVIRVAARVAGTTSDRQNSLTDGRVDLARLVGIGAEAPLRMAAVRQLAQSVCTSSAPDCQGCPLLRNCSFGQQATSCPTGV
ncbi:DNA cytosine methyltransferase [Blastococcus sp. CT_GayMR16]|uniref:DNA cytosine methyltransferase n=1 Tax=Blastococcus sp. CT_GayMR16 TaxID=2559607 RepID=UPI0010742CD8|nr:DNA cytosine methyltransferase [Blastococcus sp. CT_GayMR16]TFV87402.1 DNA cytosine methyltransferase [Blastococcus sp. CT_GayMR16]